MLKIDFKPIKIIAITSFAILLGTSCNVVYHPSTHNSPMLRNAGEIQVSGMLSTNNAGINSAYAITNHLGVMLNASIMGREVERNLADETIKFSESWGLLEGGVGYYTSIAQVVKLELFGGAGFGTVPGNLRDVDYVYDGTQITDMKKLFIQPALGIGTKLVDASLVGRFSAIQINSETEVFAEPGIVIKLGYNRLKFVGNVGLSLPLLENYNSKTWDNDLFFVGIGAQYSFGPR